MSSLTVNPETHAARPCIAPYIQPVLGERIAVVRDTLCEGIERQRDGLQFALLFKDGDGYSRADFTGIDAGAHCDGNRRVPALPDQTRLLIPPLHTGMRVAVILADASGRQTRNVPVKGL